MSLTVGMYVWFIGNAWGVAVGAELGPGVSRLGVGAISQRLGPRSRAGTDLGSLTHLCSQSSVRLLPTSLRTAPTAPPPLPSWWQLRQPLASMSCFTWLILFVSWKPG